MGQVTPMMRQYLEMKEQNKDCLLFFRLGDFYELFFEDAITASKELEIVLTGRDCGLKERAPMCGVPYHSVEGYINKLISKGFKVAICEQLSDPALSPGLVERGIIRIVTPGTVIEESMLDEKKNNYIMSIFSGGNRIGFAVADVSTGEFSLGEIDSQGVNDSKAARETLETKLFEELARIEPTEIIINSAIATSEKLYKGLKGAYYLTEYADWAFEYFTAFKNLLLHFNTGSLDGFGCSDLKCGICAAGAMLAYLNETQKNALSHINTIRVFRRSNHMVLDATTRRNLELTQPLRGSAKRSTLINLLDKTQTAMGGRMLRSWIEQPLNDVAAIENRLESVHELKESFLLRDKLRSNLNEVYDIERLCSRIAYNTLNARDALALKRSIERLPAIKQDLSLCNSSAIQEIVQEFDTLEDMASLLENSIALDPPVGIKDGGLIREKYNVDVDKLNSAATQSKNWLEALERKEREETGIKSLRVGFNKVFGYYIEITKSYVSQVPFRFERKQTLANAERYVTPELKELENSILGAQERLIALEYSIFCEIRSLLNSHITRLQLCAKQLAQLDVFQSLATVAASQDYCRPSIHAGGEIEIIEGRHPVVEFTQPNRFVPNDTLMDNEKDRILIITGPNMAGKSTYMRQVALIALMAHIGSFVPAKSAKISLLDRIFTRVGASDDLASGQSTFMVEMSEMANILRNATGKSLLLLDEIGRGTSTFDGLSIAWAVVEYICDKRLIGAKTLFATHYHELSELEELLEGVKNFRITVKEMGDNIIFLRKIVRGGTDKSFGVQVARLAGIPEQVILRAKELLAQLEASEITHSMQDNLGSAKSVSDGSPSKAQMQLIRTMKELDINSITPLEAMTILYDLQQKAKDL